MKFASLKLSLVVACAATVAFTGCTKKPVRPIPSDTSVFGQTGGGPGPDTGINPMQIATTTPPGLENRDNVDKDGYAHGVLESVYFDYDQSSIKQAERVKLQAAKEYLDKNPQSKLRLEGRCDWRGTAEYNLSLGDRRAAAAKKYLLSLGVKAESLDVLSKGSEEAMKNGDEGAMAKDRRVDILVFSPGGPGTFNPNAAATAAQPKK